MKTIYVLAKLFVILLLTMVIAAIAYAPFLDKPDYASVLLSCSLSMWAYIALFQRILEWMEKHSSFKKTSP